MNDHEEVPVEISTPAIPRPYIPPPVVIPPPPTPPHFSPESSKSSPSASPSVDEDDLDESGSGGELVAFNTRFTAAMIDVVVMAGIVMGLSFILPAMASRLAWLVGAAYFVTRDSLPFLKGQSVGKKAMKIKVVTTEGESLVNNWSVALIRNGILLIPFLPFIELYILLKRDGKAERGLRLGDEWAKTRVIAETIKTLI